MPPGRNASPLKLPADSRAEEEHSVIVKALLGCSVRVARPFCDSFGSRVKSEADRIEDVVAPNASTFSDPAMNWSSESEMSPGTLKSMRTFGNPKSGSSGSARGMSCFSFFSASSALHRAEGFRISSGSQPCRCCSANLPSGPRGIGGNPLHCGDSGCPSLSPLRKPTSNSSFPASRGAQISRSGTPLSKKPSGTRSCSSPPCAHGIRDGCRYFSS
mmetsp:Transcript_61099/g.162280  ORF Transcript_61099/g.162280 Transcript_61099/m.162280 type:complete len:216 (+) Transcript_61099:821-1468(+)